MIHTLDTSWSTPHCAKLISLLPANIINSIKNVVTDHSKTAPIIPEHQYEFHEGHATLEQLTG